MDDPPSPCNGICRIAPSGLCAGCRRTLDEIAAWRDLSAEGRRAIIAALPDRRA
ncbi:DUF1289 domain-containing protein [Novosphingobium flavum]|uniref:DUF1289 domain-containing protein n=1 Tax=Novosphingobium flavum TaxID=1778672 RepID=A0A7X1FPI2_9SPHN|nr:DUF1289 domain-containing protein [Novosphingobium flavum]MBC2664615.1 DUF1289 domain-containing protein [Novosphingobium flavum]